MTALPYRWRPSGTTKRLPVAGDLFPSLHKVYRVIEVRAAPEIDWTDDDRERVRMYSRGPLGADRFKPLYIIIAEVRPGAPDGPSRHYKIGGGKHYSSELEVYRSEHYPVCSTCLEPMPCRHLASAEAATRTLEHMSRYDRPGWCPACGDAVTARMESVTWAENIEVPGGPPVTFHVGRRACRYASEQYAKRMRSTEAQPAPSLFDDGAQR